MLYRAEPGSIGSNTKRRSPWVKGEASGDEAKRNASYSLRRKAEYTGRSSVHRNDPENTPAADFPG